MKYTQEQPKHPTKRNPDKPTRPKPLNSKPTRSTQSNNNRTQEKPHKDLALQPGTHKEHSNYST